MSDINLLLGLSNFVLIWITIYSAVIELKWRHEDRQKDAVTVEEKKKQRQKLVRKDLERKKTVEKRLEILEKVVENG